MTKRIKFPDGSTGIDLSGQKFGKLTVIKYARKNKANRSFFYCKCECGNTKVIRQNSLLSGHTKSCGCLASEPDLNIIGKKFNILTAIRFAGRDIKHNYGMFEFQCDCGNKKILRGSHVVTGGTRSCGCLKDAKARSHIGEVHNRLTIIDIEWDNKENRYQMICTCSCASSKRTLVRYDRLVRGDVKSCGCYLKETSSITGSTIGINNSRSAARIRWSIDNLYLRSGYEVLFVLGLKRFDIPFVYEPKTFTLKNGMRYRPDFYLPDIDTWVEVKGFMKGKDQEKLEAFAALGNKIMLYMLKDVEQFSGIKYRKLLKSGIYNQKI